MTLDLTINEIDIDMATRGFDCVYKQDEKAIFCQTGKMGGTFVSLRPDSVALRMINFQDGYKEEIFPEDIIIYKGADINLSKPDNIIKFLIASFAYAVDSTRNYSFQKYPEVLKKYDLQKERIESE